MSSKITRSITSRAPTRIDLSGGTIDLWPLFLFFKNPTTINLAINLFAETKLVESKSNGKPQVTLKSLDQKKEVTFPWSVLDEDPSIDPGLILHFKLLRHFFNENPARKTELAQSDLLLETQAKSPAGAGLGGSSTLCISMIGSLVAWARSQAPDVAQEGEKFIDVVRDIETTVIQVPAGLQDYYGAMFGGLQSLRWQIATHRHTHFSEDLIPALEERLLLFYSGQSRNSGINNWALFKGLIDKQPGVHETFEKINAATLKLESALVQRDWTEASRAISEEWTARKTLAAGITTPEMDHAIEAASKLGPMAAKVCGAGGGGCFFVFLPEGAKLREKVIQVFSEHGMGNLPFRAAPRGLEVRVLGG